MKKNIFDIVPNPKNNRSLWGIGWMCFFWSTASLMVFSILPTFLVDVLGISHANLGRIEGIAIFCAFAAKVFSGVLSDYWKKRKPLIILGTSLSIIIKLMFAAANSILWIFAARTIDRLSKGIRSAPTDALIADLSPKNLEGASFGLRQTLYTLGAVFGAAIATSLMFLSSHNYRLIFLFSIIPATIALIILLVWVKAPEVSSESKTVQADWHWREARYLPPTFWKLLIVIFILMLARFSEAFLTLRAKEIGWSVAMLPLLVVGYEIVHATFAWPVGKLADRYDRKKILLAGLAVLIITNIIMILANATIWVFVGVLFAGLHMGMTQGLISALIAESTPNHLRGTAFAFYYLTTGVAVYIGNEVAGRLSDCYGLVGAFWGGGVFTTLACIALCLTMQPKRQLL